MASISRKSAAAASVAIAPLVAIVELCAPPGPLRWLTPGAALATVVGVLVEVPVMLSVCAACNRTRHWFSFQAAR